MNSIEIKSNIDLPVNRRRSTEHVKPMTNHVVPSLDSLLVDRNRRPMQTRRRSAEQMNTIPNSNVTRRKSLKCTSKQSMSSCSHVPKLVQPLDNHEKCRTTSGRRRTSVKGSLKCDGGSASSIVVADHPLLAPNRINQLPAIINSSSSKSVKRCSVPSNPCTSLELSLIQESGQSTSQHGLTWRRTSHKSKYNSLDDSDYDYRKKNSFSDLLSSMEHMLSVSDSQIPSLLELELKDLQLQQHRPAGTGIRQACTHGVSNHRRHMVSSNVHSSRRLDFDSRPSCLQLTPTGIAIMTPIEWLEGGDTCCRDAATTTTTIVRDGIS